MRRHDARKWLHAILDLLPVILIPVFMIYSHRHTIDSYTIDVPQNIVVDFNQLVKIDEPSSSNSEISFTRYTNGVIDININTTNSSQTYYSDAISNFFERKANHIYYLNVHSDSLGNSNTFWWTIQSGIADVDYGNGALQNSTSSNVGGDITLVVKGIQNLTLRVRPILMDLTQMFGAGNEPTLNEIKLYYPNDYYEYTLSDKELLKGYSTITYADTDIMSQFTYNLYNSVDKYFNMNNVFGLNGVYDWFNLNIFNGNAPLYIYVVWNIVLYEFVMDLLMLLYALFMWFIDFCQDLIDRCFITSKGGKH